MQLYTVTITPTHASIQNEVPFTVQRRAWETTDNIHCQEPQKCFGCCYTYPPTSDGCIDCNDYNDLVIGCGKYIIMQLDELQYMTCLVYLVYSL